MQNIFQTKRFRISMLVVLAIAIILFAYWLREVFIPVLLAALIAYVLNPVVNFLETKGVRRAWGVWHVFGAFVLILLVFVGIAVPMIYDQCCGLSVTIFGEHYTDDNGNGKCDEDEYYSLVDSNGNGKYDAGRLSILLLGEEFEDANNNGVYDAEERFDDANDNGAYDEGEVFVDGNGNKLYDEGEDYEDANGNGKYDAREELLVDINGNGKYDGSDGYEDANGNGRYDVGEELIVDLNGNGKYDRGPFEDFTDINGNEKYDRGCLTLILTKLHHIMRDEASQADADKEVSQRVIVGRIIERSMPTISKHLAVIARTVRDVSVKIIGDVFSGIRGIVVVVSLVLLLPVYTFFILREMNSIRDKIFEYLPGQHRDRIIDVLTKIHISVSSFFRGRLIVCVCTATVTSIGLLICGVPFWLIIGIMVGFGGLIPFVGVLVGLIPACALAYFYNGPFNVVFVVLVFIITQAMEGLVFTPFILGHEVKMHPLTLIISIFIGGRILGLLGILLAVPLVSILKILGEEFVLPSLRELASEKNKAAERESSRAEE